MREVSLFVERIILYTFLPFACCYVLLLRAIFEYACNVLFFLLLTYLHVFSMLTHNPPISRIEKFEQAITSALQGVGGSDVNALPRGTCQSNFPFTTFFMDAPPGR